MPDLHTYKHLTIFGLENVYLKHEIEIRSTGIHVAISKSMVRAAHDYVSIVIKNSIKTNSTQS